MLGCGFIVDATDGTAAMVSKARDLRGVPARQMRFDELAAEAAYDAVWAHASLLTFPAPSFQGSSSPSTGRSAPVVSISPITSCATKRIRTKGVTCWAAGPICHRRSGSRTHIGTPDSRS
ncbi:hypothetical protein [Qipengyuania soli]|uniref:hypothetical protein n=1 Tax=Qipengyuania soli TaxID=2782568 RepID=UPI0031B5C0D3